MQTDFTIRDFYLAGLTSAIPLDLLKHDYNSQPWKMAISTTLEW